VGRRMDDYVGGEEWSLAECLQILYRRKASLIGLTCIGIFGAIVATYAQPRIYRARTSLEVQAFNETFLDLRDINPAVTPSVDTTVYMQTEAELLQQDSLLDEVARKLNLGSRPEYRGPASLAGRLRRDITIAPVRNSRVIQIAADARSASLAAEIANTLADTFIEQNMRQRQASARQTYELLLPKLEELKRTLPRQPVDARGGAIPRSEVGREVYRSLEEEVYHAQLASSLPLTNIRVVSPASPPLVPDKPNRLLNLVLGTMGGFLLAVAVLMLREQRKHVLREPGDAGKYLGLSELGVIPQEGQGIFGMPFPVVQNARPRIERAALEEGTWLSESFRATVASILSARRSDGPRVLLVTSALPMEGKTTVVSNLGIALAGISNKVLLVDGDMRRPRLHKLFDEANSWGLSDLLREENAIDGLPVDVLAKRTSVPHLYLLPSGTSALNIFGLLQAGRLSRLLLHFREEFDYVLVDAPPCLEFADARIMAKYTEELLLVVRANQTDRRAVQSVVDRFRLDSIALMGVILNRWEPIGGGPYAYETWHGAGRKDLS